MHSSEGGEDLVLPDPYQQVIMSPALIFEYAAGANIVL